MAGTKVESPRSKEQWLAWLQKNHPEALPRTRLEFEPGVIPETDSGAS